MESGSLFSNEAYKARILQLFEQHQSVQTVGFASGAYKPGLEGMTELCSSLGHPERDLRCIHVAGTNGKGSVCSMIATALASEGLRVGLYTSPHLLDFRERMKIISCDSCDMISEQEVWDCLEMMEADGRSFFEITTAMAFWWFSKQDVDVAVIEVGLGGRLDSTNVIDPDLAIITSIGLDHCAILGNTREEIAREKAGILKPGVPALVWGHDEQTDPIFEKICADQKCCLFFADEMGLEDRAHSLAANADLKGDYEEKNFVTALAALSLLGVESESAEEALLHTARNTDFRGRWEIVSRNPDVICDIGHNPPALEENFRQLKESGRPLVIVYGVMADKDLDGIAQLMPSSAKYILCAPATARALPPDALASKMSSLRPDLNCEIAESVAAAAQRAKEVADAQTIIYIGGSTFVVSEFFLHLHD